VANALSAARAIRITAVRRRRITAALAIAEPTVERHVANIMDKLGVHARAQIAVWGYQEPGRAVARKERAKASSPPSSTRASPETPPELGVMRR